MGWREFVWVGVSLCGLVSVCVGWHEFVWVGVSLCGLA